MIYLIATLTIKPDSFDKIMEAVRPCLDATRKESGCISYDLHRNVTEPDKLVFVERWESRPHLDAHFTTPHLIAWRDAGEPFFLDRKIEIIEATEDSVTVL